jgi:hypothetical protein
MTADDHSPEAYRQLFAIVGAGLQATSLIFILASLLVAPWWVVVVLSIIWVGLVVWSWRVFSQWLWSPLVGGTVVAVAWIIALTVFA